MSEQSPGKTHLDRVKSTSKGREDEDSYLKKKKKKKGKARSRGYCKNSARNGKIDLR